MPVLRIDDVDDKSGSKTRKELTWVAYELCYVPFRLRGVVVDWGVVDQTNVVIVNERSSDTFPSVPHISNGRLCCSTIFQSYLLFISNIFPGRSQSAHYLTDCFICNNSYISDSNCTVVEGTRPSACQAPAGMTLLSICFVYLFHDQSSTAVALSSESVPCSERKAGVPSEVPGF